MEKYSGPERRGVDPASRWTRIKRGSGGGTAILAPAILIVFAIEQRTGQSLPDYVVLAIGGTLGIMGSVVAMCMEDIRTLVFMRFGFNIPRRERRKRAS